jgi:ubiquinone biosynthesis protein UbiJ
MSDTTATDTVRSNPVFALLGRALERVFARALRLDPPTQARIAALDGKAVTLAWRGTPIAMRLAVSDGAITVGPARDVESALRIAASPAALLTAWLARPDAGAPLAGVEIVGDAELAQRLQRIAADFAPDVDEAFAQAFGDVAGFRLARGFRRAFAWLRDSAAGLAHDAADFLTEESRDLVARAELDTFLDDVDALAERTDRLDARLRRAATRLAGTPS